MKACISRSILPQGHISGLKVTCVVVPPLYFLYLLVNGVFNFLFLILLIFSEVLIAGEPTIMGGASEEDERPITRIQNSENGTEPPKEEHNINIKSEVDG